MDGALAAGVSARVETGVAAADAVAETGAGAGAGAAVGIGAGATTGSGFGEQAASNARPAKGAISIKWRRVVVCVMRVFQCPKAILRVMLAAKPVRG